MAKRQKQFIENSDFESISPQYQRVALGNFIGTMANASSAMAAHVLSKAKVTGPDGTREIPFDLLLKLVKYTLDAYRYGTAAFDQNPEWDQYRAIAQQCLSNIQNFLEDNPEASKRLQFFLHDDPDFLKILKATRTAMNDHTRGKVKILFLNANPRGMTRLKLDEEMRDIAQKIRAAEHRDIIEIVVAHAVRPDDLLQAMNEHVPHIVHFSGHGSPNDEIILNDDKGKPKRVSKEALVSLFDSVKANVKVVVLNSCYSKPQAEAIVSIVPCAIGMKDTIGDDAARVFASSFYRAIGFGRSVEDSFKQGLTALKLEGIAEDEIPELIPQVGVDPSKLLVIKP